MTSRFPYPLEKGDKLRANEQIKLLSKHFEIHLLSTSDRKVKKEELEQLEPYCKSIHVFTISKLQILWGLFIQLVGNKPFQVSYFHHYSIQRRINKLLDNIQPDHIYCQLVRAAEYVKNYHKCPKTIDYMDALSKGMERRANSAKFIKKYIFNLEYKRLLDYENSIFEYFEYHSIISEQDKQFIPHKHKDAILIIPNGVNASFFERPAAVQVDADLIFIGNMSYAPNVQAAQFIAQQILPLIGDSVQVKIAGSSPSKDVLKLASSQVKITGYVEDIKKAYCSAKIFVAPMFIGSGLQNKLLEAMALGIPCITTTLANNALGAQPEKEILIANNREEFAEQIRRLLGAENLREELGKAGQAFIKENFNWEKVSVPLVEILKFGNSEI